VLKYIFGAVFIVLAWAVVLVFHNFVSIWPAIAVTVLIVIGLLAWELYKAVKNQRAAQKIEKALEDQASNEAGDMRPDQMAEIAAMQAEFRRAVAALKDSKLGRSSRDALGVLPWYVIIGPPGAGKTTALRNSGLKFPYAGRGGVRGVGGTRNCDWWLTNEAILLDTAGRWSTDDDDREEWLAFLDMLRNTRPGKPVNGILLAVSVAELQAAEDEIAALARKLRERVDEVMSRLQMVVPVYLLVTKCDLCPGFIETFGELRDKERGQIWGISLPLGANPHERQQMLGERLEELVKVIETRTLVRLAEERSLEARPRIYEFPQQFASIRQSVADLCAHLFVENAFQDAPIMRGVYFTSGTQEGKPIDRIMVRMAEAFGIRPRVAAAVAPTKPKSYFVRDVFTHVVIPDRDVAVRSSGMLRKQRLVSLAVTAGTLVAAVTLLFLPISSYLENARLVEDSMTFVETVGRARARQGTGALAPQALEAVERMTARLQNFEDSGPDVSLRFGLYVGDKVMDPLALAIERMMIRPLLDVDAEHMAAFLRGTGRADPESMFQALMVHLMLTQPKAADEPAPESGRPWQKKWVPRLAQAAGARWEALLGPRATTRARMSLEAAVTFYGLRTEESTFLPDRRNTLVSRVRQSLLGAPGDPLGDLLRDPSLPRDLKAVDLMGAAVTAFRNEGDAELQASIPGAFTFDGWRIIKRRLAMLAEDKHLQEDNWVLGDQSRQKKVDAAAVQTLYFRRYIEVWKSFFLALVIKEPPTVSAARQLVKSMLLDKPLDIIWKNADRDLNIQDIPEESLAGNIATSLNNAANKKLDGISERAGVKPTSDMRNQVRRRYDDHRAGPEALGPEDVREEFSTFLAFGLAKPTGLDSYAGIMADLSAALGETNSPDPKRFADSMRTMKSNLSRLVSNYRGPEGWEPNMLERLLTPPLRGTEIAVLGASTESANRRWCDSIVTAYDQVLAGRYPFATGAEVRDVRISDVERFFMPKTGTLWSYFTESLQSDIEHPAGSNVFRLKEEASIHYEPALLSFLRRASEITDFLFKDPTKLQVNYAIRLRSSPPYQKILFQTGGKTVTYFNSREMWSDLVWPARGASFALTERSGSVQVGHSEVEWALFHLLDEAKIQRQSDSDDYLHASWTPDLGDGPVLADLKPSTLLKPFAGLTVPRSVVPGTRACGGGMASGRAARDESQ
jgi:type VI secretion system protein ImpL